MHGLALAEETPLGEMSTESPMEAGASVTDSLALTKLQWKQKVAV
jgi:hypothetical protein